MRFQILIKNYEKTAKLENGTIMESAASRRVFSMVQQAHSYK